MTAILQPARKARESTLRLNLPILVVDDEVGVRESLSLYLQKKQLQVVQAGSSDEALKCLEKQRFCLVISDISMPGSTNGLDLLDWIRVHRPDTDVMLMTGHLDIDYAIGALKKGAFDYFKKPFLFEEVQMSIQRAIERRKLLEKSKELDRLRNRNTTMAELHTQFMVSLAGMIDAKCRYTRMHSERVSAYAQYLAKDLGVTGAELRKVTIGGKLHDIGKLAIPEEILNKPGELTTEEWQVVKAHPARGAELLKPIVFMEPYLPIVRWHHENIDGSGYPDGIRGDQIPESVLIVKIADYYDAITSNRPYREPMTLRQAVDTLQSEIGKGFPETLVTTFVQMIERAPWKASGTASV